MWICLCQYTLLETQTRKELNRLQNVSSGQMSFLGPSTGFASLAGCRKITKNTPNINPISLKCPQINENVPKSIKMPEMPSLKLD